MECRRSVAQLTSGEKADFVGAVLALKKAPSLVPAAQTAISAAGGTPNRYDDFVWMHNVLGTGGHRGSAFGPWHREFLRQFELDLRKVSGKPDIAVPYWDWTVDRTPAAPGWPFTDDFLGGFGTPGGSHEITVGPFSDPGTAASPGPWRVFLSTVQTGQFTSINLGPRLKRSNGIQSPLSLPLAQGVLTALAILAYDQNPWNELNAGVPPLSAAQVDAAFRKYLERRLHDGIHVWIGYQTPPPGPGVVPTDGGHMSFPPVAVNDPVFWLHHANVDRLWTIWQQRHPTLGYEPASGGNAGHNRTDVMARFADASHFSFPLAGRPVDVLDWHARGVWYASDLPVITPVSSSVNFDAVPEGLTVFRPVQFEVRTCQRVKFRITAVSGGGFSIPPAQGTVVVEHSDAQDTVVANVYLAFQAGAPLGVPAAGAATIEAVIDDADGYFAAAVNGEHPVGSWTVNMTATPVERPRSAIALVLDRSGSMSSSAGVAGTKYDLLKSSLQVTADLMQPNDAIGIVVYDSGTTPPFGLSDGVKTLAPITAMGPVAPPGPGRTAVAGAIASPDLAPRGMTAIGQGMIEGASVLDAERTSASTPYTRFAMLVMTDGNENVLPYVTQAPVTSAVAGFSDSVYAVGLGSATGVSAATLGAIARYMLITGDITVAEQRFRLTKYFVQILARIANNAIVTDPQGDLHLGTTHRIPFQLTEGDVGVDVIALSPAAQLLDFRLIAPDGTVITPSNASPNVVFFQGREDAYYRLGLPAVPGVPGTHGGEWTAVLRVSRRGALGLAARGPERAAIAGVLAKTGTVPYSLVVQSYSNIVLDAELAPGAARPGESLSFLATLKEYDVMVDGRAQVVVEVLEPSGGAMRVSLKESSPGVFQGEYRTRMRGVHTCRFRAAGISLGGQRFQREETRTAAVFAPPRDGPLDRDPSDGRGRTVGAGDDFRRTGHG